MMSTTRKLFLGLPVLALLCGSAMAFINPNFTPIDLVKQSDVIVAVEVKSVDKAGLATVTVVGKEIKGEFKDKEFKVDLMAGVVEADGKAVMQRINDGAKQGVLFVGMFRETDGQAEGEAKGFLHLGGQWEVLSRNKDNTGWDLDKTEDHMLGTWSGGTDMLLRVVDYVQHDPDPTVPVRESIEWGKELQIAKLEGKIVATTAVDLSGQGKIDLFIAAEKGDRLFHWNGKAFEDVTAKAGLTSKSLAFAWGDFGGSGRQDLASWDGKGLTIFTQGKDGTFSGKAVSAGEALKGGCLGLTTFDNGNKGRAALLVSTKASPVVVTMAADSSVAAKPLVAGELPSKDLGEAAECLVADLDGDGLPDIMQMFTGGGLFYKGTKPGEFAAPVKVAVGVGEGRHGMCLGDWEASGRLDIFTCCEGRNHLWHNMGGGKFVEAIDKSGSVAYIAKPGGTFAQEAAFNGDGRQGLLVLYSVGMAPQLFFNRGFRSFGLSRGLEKQLKSDLPATDAGEQAGCLADFRNEGAMGEVLALVNGEVWFFPQNLEEKAMGVTAALSPTSPNAGPVMVWVAKGTAKDNRPFGAAAIRVGDRGVFYGLKEAGPAVVKWQFPGGEVQQKEVIIEGKVIRVLIDKESAKQSEKPTEKASEKK
jgi:hypothetical protein